MTISKRHVWVAVTIGIVVFGACIIYFVMCHGLREFLYPKPPHMPKVVKRSLEAVLQDLESVLAEKVPFVANQLQPGLSSGEIDELEKKAGVKLTNELRALYMWHNGCSTETNQDFMPGHLFLPLDTTVEQKMVIKQQLESAPRSQRYAFNLFAGHRLDWITIFDDRCGDGYFYDPKRKNNESCIFYHFAEDGYYFFFPSLKNLLAAITECYRQSAYLQESGSNTLKENYQHSERIFAGFGAECR